MNEKLLYSLVGKKISQARKDSPFTQAMLAKAVGLTRASVANVERGHQKLSLYTLFEIAAILGREPTEFLPDSTQVADPASSDSPVPPIVSEHARVAIESAISKTIKKHKKG